MSISTSVIWMPSMAIRAAVPFRFVKPPESARFISSDDYLHNDKFDNEMTLQWQGDNQTQIAIEAQFPQPGEEVIDGAGIWLCEPCNQVSRHGPNSEWTYEWNITKDIEGIRTVTKQTSGVVIAQFALYNDTGNATNKEALSRTFNISIPELLPSTSSATVATHKAETPKAVIGGAVGGALAGLLIIFSCSFYLLRLRKARILRQEENPSQQHCELGSSAEVSELPSSGQVLEIGSSGLRSEMAKHPTDKSQKVHELYG